MKQLRHILSLGMLVALVSTASAQSWLTNGLVAYYPFNGNVNDESGNQLHGISFNTVSDPDRNGRTNTARKFNPASGSRVEIPWATNLVTNITCFSFWFKKQVSFKF